MLTVDERENESIWVPRQECVSIWGGIPTPGG